ncbi:MAG: hypothetical protein AAGI63_11680, partial [Planctomycetota bacterium]
MSNGNLDNKLLHVLDHQSKANRPAMRRSVIAPFILWLYRLLNCKRRWRIGRPLIRLATRLEGGAM